jgi:dihydrofolate synthase/folylpolyglutamate synthase
LSIITNIGWDHMNILGDTLQLIAAEKAGIIKQGIPVIIGEHQPDIASIFLRKAAQEEADIDFASDDWSVEFKVESEKLKVKSLDLLDLTVHKKNFQPSTFNLQLDLTGSYQLKNIKTVLSAVEELRSQGFVITDDHIKTALRQVKTLTGLHGRWEVLSRNPLTICDTGHNPEGIQEVLKNISSVNYDHLHFVIGMVNDKDISKVLSMLPTDATYYFCKPDIPRGLEAEALQQKAESAGLHGNTYPSVKAAFDAAQKAAQANDLVFAGGSTFVVAEVV